jgi:ribose transport system ATP-binding protein
MAEMSAAPPEGSVGPNFSSAAHFEMRRIRKAFGATVALDGVDLSVRAGEVCALVGQNGAGKSTLMAILAGALAPDAGSMTIDGRRFAPRSPIDARRAGVAMIYQELSLAPHLSVMENILLGAEPSRGGGLLDWAEMRRRAAAALAELGHDDIDPAAPVESLSVAAQQLVEIARAIAVGCRVLVLDEPTSSLGRDDVRRLFELVRRLKSQGHAIVYISHFLEEVKDVADRVVVLRDGRNAGEVGIDAPTETIVSMMVGRQVDDLFSPVARQPGEALLEVHDLEPGSASFTLHRGEVFGIAGLVGAGRTRLLRAIFGLEAVRRGRIRVGTYSGRAVPHERWKQGAGFLSEDRKGEGLALGLSVADNVTLTRLSPFEHFGLISPRRQRSGAREWIERLDIRCAGPSQTAGELSGGNQQKLAIARLLHHDVDLLILDEPTRGIDIASKAQIYTLITELVAPSPERVDGSMQRAILLVSSYLPELLGLCDRVAVMSRGRLGPARPAAGLTEHDLVLAATGSVGAPPRPRSGQA